MQQPAVHLTQSELPEFLLDIAPEAPVFIWGAPGIGKSALVGQFSDMVGYELVSLVGTQLAPEDVMGVPQITPDGRSRFCPPTVIARVDAHGEPQPYTLFLDELNASTPDVQKAFYSLIHDRRLGEFELPAGTVVIGAGNRAQDAAIVRQMSSALINRMVHVHLRVSSDDWLAWARGAGVHPLIVEYVALRPDQLHKNPPKTENTFSSPRSWHLLSKGLHARLRDDDGDVRRVEQLAYGCLTREHAQQFVAYFRSQGAKYQLARILKGEESWPREADERDRLYFLVQSFRAQLVKELPADRAQLAGQTHQTLHRAKELLVSLAEISVEMAQQVLAADEDDAGLPAWFMVEVVRDVPRLAEARA